MPQIQEMDINELQFYMAIYNDTQVDPSKFTDCQLQEMFDVIMEHSWDDTVTEPLALYVQAEYKASNYSSAYQGRFNSLEDFIDNLATELLMVSENALSILAIDYDSTWNRTLGVDYFRLGEDKDYFFRSV